MADTSLDDFFAKKDKSKKKNKARYTADDLLAKQKEEPKKPDLDKREEKQQQDADKPAEKTVTQLRKEQDEQWVDFEDEKDYSGLRIQNLQLKENEQGGDDNGLGEENDEEGEANQGQGGPWMNKNAPAKPVETPAPPPPSEEPEVKPAPAEPTKYRAPGMRNQSTTAAPTQRRRGKKVAPNLTSEEDFPTLGGATPDMNFDDGTGHFEKVRSGGRQLDESQQGIKLELGNKFDALQGGTD